MSGKFALIIGNTEYTDPGLAQLTAPGKDAEDFARVLKDTEIGAFDQVNIVLNQSSSASIEAIDEFFNQRMPDDLLVLYFSGHGVRDELGALYLAVKNTIRSRLRSTAIKSDYIREAMDQSRSRRQVLILDCCNSGAFAQGTKAATGVSIGTASAFEGGYGRIILTASDSTQFAWEGDKVIGETDNSLFTHYLVEGLEGEADLDGDGRITVDEVYDYAYEKVRFATPKQTPSKFSTRQQGEIVLRQSMRIENIKPVELPGDLVDEIDDTRPYVREEAVRKLEKIIKGRNIGLARSAREALAKIATDDDSRRVSQAALQVLDSFRLVEEKAEAEQRAKEEAERLAALKAEEERLMREKAEAERKAKEEAEKLARAQAERKAAEAEAARLKAERKAAELAAQEASEKASKEKAKKEAAERDAVQKAEQEAIELASRKKAERKAAEKAEREAEKLVVQKKAERKAKEEVVLKESRPFKALWLKPTTIGIIVVALILCGLASWNYLYGIFLSPVVTATEEPAATEESPSTTQGVAREDTVILGWSMYSPIGTTNPWAVPGYTHQEGNAFMWEPLMYFAIFADKEIPWLADSMEYTNDDFTELIIKLNEDATWSDGTPVTSRDVAFTFEGQLTNDRLPYYASFEQFVDSVATPDDQTVVVTFKIPAPRFAFEVLMFKFDTGIPIVPAHVLEAETDVNDFAGGLDMVHSGPYNLVHWDANQKIYELREDWWAVKAGRIAMPSVKRIVMVNIGGQVDQNMDILIQGLANNEFDAILDVGSGVAKQILDENPNVTTHTGSESPYGNIDFWTNSLWMNTQIEPFNDVRVRRAMSLSINRDQIDEILYDGSKVTTIYPFPLYPGLQKFVDSPAVKALEEQYQPRKFDLDESAALMYEVGFAKNSDGLWEKDGATVPAVINGFEGIHADIVAVLVQMLYAGGFDASIDFSSEAFNHMANGDPGLYMFGHGASLKDPYAALELFHGRFSAPIGTYADYPHFSRYSNDEYDAILDQMAPLSADDPVFQDLAAIALGIYWRDQIDIPVIEWFHRIPYNQTYWINWPTADNLAMGTNGAFWHHTGLLVITSLEKAK